MAYDKHFYQHLQNTAAKAEKVEHNLKRGVAACLELSKQWNIAMRCLGSNSTRKEASEFFRGIFAKMNPGSEEFFLNEDLCPLDELREKVLATYAVLSAVGRDDTESPLVAVALTVCKGIQAHCTERINGGPLLLTASRPQGRKVGELRVFDGGRA